MSRPEGIPLSIGILTHNGLHHTQRCLDSLRRYTRSPWRATVIDNASSDDTPAWLSALKDPRITVELRTDNLGVGGGRNRLFELMLPSMPDTDVLVFLDNDIEVGDGWDVPFQDAFTRSDRLGVAGRWAFNMLVHDAWRDILPEKSNDDGPADTVQGCCFWVRAATARAVGAFDEALGRFWHEDDDYCVRALHAGWDVQRIWSPAIVHHEHGSGAALRPDRVAGSLANQAYLARKWRSFGAIDAHGVPRRTVADPTQPLRDQLGARLGRRGPLLRTEWNSAVADAARLLQLALTDTQAAVLATPVVRELLSDSAAPDVDGGPAPARVVIERIARTLAERRAQCDATAPATRVTRGFSGICNPAAWDDAKWYDSYRASFHDGRGTDFYSRHEYAWRDGQLVHALRVAGALRREARVLIIGHASPRLVAAMTHAVGHVTILDQPIPSIDQVATWAGRPLGPAALHVGAWPPASLPTADDDRYDVVLCPHFSRYAPPGQVERALTVLGTFARAHALVALAASVRLSGPSDTRWLAASVFADDALLARAALRRVGAFDASIADETLLAAVAADDAPGWGPRLSRLIGAHLVSSASLMARVVR